jgi:hypothetical protein
MINAMLGKKGADIAALEDLREDLDGLEMFAELPIAELTDSVAVESFYSW